MLFSFRMRVSTLITIFRSNYFDERQLWFEYNRYLNFTVCYSFIDILKSLSCFRFQMKKIQKTSWGWAGPSSAEIEVEVENGGFYLVIILINLMIWGLIINLINFAFLCLAVFTHFDTFPDGCLGKNQAVQIVVSGVPLYIGWAYQITYFITN